MTRDLGPSGPEAGVVEARIHHHFGPRMTAAVAAALSEVRLCSDPTYLQMVQEELGPGVGTDEDAIVTWAIRRGAIWATGPASRSIAAARL